MDGGDIGANEGVEQKAALARILALGQDDIEAGRFRDVEEFFAEIEQRTPDC
ncbi:hypothetical protein [Paraburkholderia flagellata]|uniref:hypothetical protein n=1 Tax=Paraburkholderia flagellata TaxID=2883241 RepID=UPI001F2BAA64|nr:hypothetical protein [Paraburkholderia flagellata]